MFLVLLLLEFLPILALLRDCIVLLLLVFLVQLRVSRLGGSGALDRRQVLRMGGEVGASSRGNRRRAVVRRKPLLGVTVGGPRMLSLSGYRPNTPATSSSLFLGSGARVDAAVAAVVADAVNPLVHPCVVNVVDGVGVHAVHRGVVEKMPVVPAAAFITATEVSEAIVDSTVETYRHAPVAFIEHKSGAAPTPKARSPQVPG